MNTLSFAQFAKRFIGSMLGRIAQKRSRLRTAVRLYYRRIPLRRYSEFNVKMSNLAVLGRLASSVSMDRIVLKIWHSRYVIRKFASKEQDNDFCDGIITDLQSVGQSDQLENGRGI